MNDKLMPTNNPILGFIGDLLCVIALTISFAGVMGEWAGGIPNYDLSTSIFLITLIQHSIRLFLWLMFYPIAYGIIGMVVLVIDRVYLKEKFNNE